MYGPDYTYSKIKLDNPFLKQFFFKIISTLLDHNLKDAGYFIRVSIISFKKFFLKYVYNVYNFLNTQSKFISESTKV